MTTMFEQAQDFLVEQLTAAGMEVITYSRGGYEVGDFSAVRGSSSHQSMDGNGVIITADTVDFLIPADGFSPFPPQRGDKITDASGYNYVIAPPSGVAPYTHIGGLRKLWRIRTKRVES